MLEEEEKAPKLRRVRVVRPKNAKPEGGTPLVVRGPAGILIEGLDVEGVAALVRALS
jgi:hypothetical protein